MPEFFKLGGYAIYVWPPYGLAAVVLWLYRYLRHRQHEQIFPQLKRRNHEMKQPNRKTK